MPNPEPREAVHENLEQALENARVKRIAVNIWFFFYKMSHFETNESFCDRPFIMSELGGGWPEKFVGDDGPPIANLVATGQPGVKGHWVSSVVRCSRTRSHLVVENTGVLRKSRQQRRAIAIPTRLRRRRSWRRKQGASAHPGLPPPLLSLGGELGSWPKPEVPLLVQEGWPKAGVVFRGVARVAGGSQEGCQNGGGRGRLLTVLASLASWRTKETKQHKGGYDLMNRKTVVSSGLTLAALAVLLTLPGNLRAGPTLLCHALVIGDARSLPWGSTSHWDAAETHYDLSHLAGDTLALLDPQMPVIVRMETLRRATLYAQRDPYVAKELLVRLQARAIASDAGGRPDALAWFDYGYLVECYKQTGWVPGSHGEGSTESELARRVDGYGAVEKAISLRGSAADTPQMEFAAALIGLEGPKPGQHRHAQTAMDAASKGQDSLLADNLYKVPFLGKDNAATALMQTMTAKK
jgi:hypothetical protein